MRKSLLKVTIIYQFSIYLIQSSPDKAVKGTVVNRIYNFKNEGSLEIKPIPFEQLFEIYICEKKEMEGRTLYY